MHISSHHFDSLNLINRNHIAAFLKAYPDSAYLTLACHAAFPPALTSDLLYKMWVNFLKEENEEELLSNLVMVSDILQSSLCVEIGQDLYEMRPAIQHALLQILNEQPEMSGRVIDLARFVQDYLQHNPIKIPSSSFRQALYFHAVTHLDEVQAAQYLLQAVKQTYETHAPIQKVDYLLSLTLKRNQIQANEVGRAGDPLQIAQQIAQGFKAYQGGRMEEAIRNFRKVEPLIQTKEVAINGFQVPIPLEVWEAIRPDPELPVTPTERSQGVTEMEKEIPVVFLASSSDDEDLRIEHELSGIRRVLYSAIQQNHVELIERPNATYDDIWQVFNHPLYSDRITIFHYTAYREDLTLISPNSEEKQETGLLNLLTEIQLPNLNLVFLNGCTPDTKSPQLIEAGIPRVLTTPLNINPSVASDFAIRFYEMLAAGAPPSRAFQMAEADQIAILEQDEQTTLWEVETDQMQVPWSYQEIQNLGIEWQLVNFLAEKKQDKEALKEKSRELKEITANVIFIAYANDRVDSNRYLRNLVEETRIIREVLDQNPDLSYRIEIRPNATLEDIISVFDRNEGQVGIFHYAGHPDSLQLMLEEGQGISEVSSEGFRNFLAAQSGLQLVFFNGCTTQTFALSLLTAGVPQVIATDPKINDQAARIFTEHFYQKLASQKTITQAFEEAEIKTQIALSTNESSLSLLWNDLETSPSSFPWTLYGDKTNGLLFRRPSLDSLTSIVHLMVNRDKQVEVFRDSLEVFMIDEKHLAQFYIIHGARPEQHHSLVRRFCEVDIRYYREELYGPELGGLVYFYEVKEWPYTGDLAMRRRNLKRSIARTVEYEEISGGKWKAEDLMKAQNLRGGTVVFQHTIAAEKWDTNALKLIEWYVRDFWEMSMVEGVPQFIIFLNILFPDENSNLVQRLFNRPNQRQRIQQQLSELAAQVKSKVLMLRELQPVSYEDVLAWVGEYFPDELAGLPDILYAGDKNRRLPMQVVERSIKKEVTRIDRKKVRESLFDPFDSSEGSPTKG